MPRLCGVVRRGMEVRLGFTDTWGGCGLPGGFGHVPNHSKPDLRPDPWLVHLGPSPIYDIWNAECGAPQGVWLGRSPR